MLERGYGKMKVLSGMPVGVWSNWAIFILIVGLIIFGVIVFLISSVLDRWRNKQEAILYTEKENVSVQFSCLDKSKSEQEDVKSICEAVSAVDKRIQLLYSRQSRVSLGLILFTCCVVLCYVWSFACCMSLQQGGVGEPNFSLHTTYKTSTEHYYKINQATLSGDSVYVDMNNTNVYSRMDLQVGTTLTVIKGAKPELKRTLITTYCTVCAPIPLSQVLKLFIGDKLIFKSTVDQLVLN
jgi:hypothetical protein